MIQLVLTLPDGPVRLSCGRTTLVDEFTPLVTPRPPLFVLNIHQLKLQTRRMLLVVSGCAELSAAYAAQTPARSAGQDGVATTFGILARYFMGAAKGGRTSGYVIHSECTS